MPTLNQQFVSYTDVNWEPLEKLAAEDSRINPAMFMWMNRDVVLQTGQHVHAYKHINTRRYLHLTLSFGDRDVECWRYQTEGVYRRTHQAAAIAHVLS